MTTARDHLSKADTVTIAAIEAGVPMLVEARGLIDSFHSMIRKTADDLEPWTICASNSLVASFASGILRDRAAVRAAITEPLFGPDEGGDGEHPIRRSGGLRSLYSSIEETHWVPDVLPREEFCRTRFFQECCSHRV